MNKCVKKLTIPAAIIFIAVLSSCFSPWQPDEALITLYFGEAGGRAVFDTEENDNEITPEKVIKLLEHRIRLSGSGVQTFNFEKGATSAKFSVAAGRYDITVEAYVDLVDLLEFDGVEPEDLEDVFGSAKGKFLVARSSRIYSVDVIAGKNNPVVIEMEWVEIAERDEPGDEDIPAEGIALNIKNLELAKGETKTLTAVVSPSNANNYAISWSSSNDAVATVNNGTVTALSLGEALITAAINDEIFDTCEVTVTIAGAEGLKFELINGKDEYSVTAYTPPAGTVSEIYVPDTYNGLPVTEIYKGVFDEFIDRSDLIKITLPFVGHTLNGITNTYFGWVFGAYGASSHRDDVPASLKTVILTGGSIPDSAFQYCENITSITLPEGITTIGDTAFHYCENLTSINLPDSLTTINQNAFTECLNLGSITIPAKVTTIQGFAFGHCSSLTTVIFAQGSNITSFGEEAFPPAVSNPGTNYLKWAYEDGGTGTYMRDSGGTNWTKMGEVNISSMTSATEIKDSIEWHLTKGYNVTVTGIKTGITDSINLTILSGLTVTWEADYTTDPSSNSSAVLLNGGGDFIIASDGNIEGSPNGSVISGVSSTGRIIVRGNITHTENSDGSSNSGSGISSSSATVIADGGTIISTTDGYAIEAYGNNDAKVIILPNSTLTTMGSRPAISVSGNAKLAILGGTISIEGSSSAVVWARETSTIYVEGGVIEDEGIQKVTPADTPTGYFTASFLLKFKTNDFILNDNLFNSLPPNPWWD